LFVSHSAALSALVPQVAVKVLDGHAVLRRDETTGFCLEALLSEQLKVRTSFRVESTCPPVT
jgi:hypothetical protein